MQWIPHAVLVASMWCTAVVASPPQARATAPHSLDATRAALDAARARVREQSSTYHDPVGPRTWIDGARLWYCETARDGARRWWLVDASAKGDAVKVPLFDHAAAAEALAKAGRACGPGRLPVREIAVERTGDGASVRVALEGLEQPLAFALGGKPAAAGTAQAAEPEPVDALDEAASKAQEGAKAAQSAATAVKPAAPKPAAPASATARAEEDNSKASAIAEATATEAPQAPDAAETGLFEPDGFTPSATGRSIVNAVTAELSLPAPAPVPEAAGEEPYQKHARDRKFDEFRRKAARYVQLKKQLLPLGRTLADGTATPAERTLHNRLKDAIAVEFKPLNRYLWDERWSEADRAAMGWILFVRPD
jgi:hypothetical protein